MSPVALVQTGLRKEPGMPQNGSILIVDDEETILQSTAALLRTIGYECDCARDAYQAIEMLRVKQYNLMVSDINMPGNHNFRLVWEAREIDHEMPIILVTGCQLEDSVLVGLKLPVVACLSKPINGAELEECVRASTACV
jgi:DNA-binding response OmpR family regulator